MVQINNRMHGMKGKDALGFLLNSLCVKPYLKKVDENIKIGRDGFSNKDQFRAHYVITFYDDSKWCIYSTTSCRSDRIEGIQWVAYNFKDIQNIEKAYLIYSNTSNKRDLDNFKKLNGDIETRFSYSSLNGILSQSRLFDLIEEKALKSYNNGAQKTYKGNIYEVLISTILSYTDNLKLLQGGSNQEYVGMYYDVFKSVIFDLDIKDMQKIEKIEATNDKNKIGRLPSGGNPKTDVLVNIMYKNKNTETRTISCKRSVEDSVSVHEYKADDFADVLDKNNEKLRRYLNEFQKVGAATQMKEEDKKGLELELKPLLKKLCRWVIGGYGGKGQGIQNADYILMYDEVNIIPTVHTLDDYCKILLRSKKAFGTPFSWTYPSKKRGESIQLKAKLVKD